MPPGNSLRIEVDAEQGKQAVRDWIGELEDGGEKAVSALAVMAEGPMKAEAPEGTGDNPPSLRDSIETRPDTPSDEKVVQPFKRTGEGWLLARAIVGQPTTPTYRDERPPVGPLMAWARAKLGDASAAWAIREQIFQEGHESFPNRFIDRSMKTWENQVEEVAGQAVREALS